MPLKLNMKYLNGFIKDSDIFALENEITAAHNALHSQSGKGSEFTGWLDLPIDYDKIEFERIKVAARQIQKKCDVFISIGIGGSYLGAKAAIDFLKSSDYNSLKKDTPDIYFIGNGISADKFNNLISICEGKDVCINVISKSGTTTEPAIAFRIFKKIMEDKYGKEEASKRIYVTTDKETGTLKEIATREGYETFVVPDDIGGRYSVLTPVGLLAIAVSGVNIDELMSGAAKARETFFDPNLNDNDCYKYAAIRNLLYRCGKKVELLVSYDPDFSMMSEWFKQLFGESEGKENKGIFPASAIFSTDLHSLGQYIQDGERFLFETVVNIMKPNNDLIIDFDDYNLDGLNFVANKPISYVNQKAFEGTILAHCDGGVPNVVLEIPQKNAFELGYLIYFFEKACAISGYVLGVNPFDQPGVESYKKNMFALLDKPGFEDRKKALIEKFNV
ncbi:MAG: glucose-6-phosphate isomerase [Clostridia bacterium]|nr:glucose-6-phosphate isomerase [Clostridia bacterium]